MLFIFYFIRRGLHGPPARAARAGTKVRPMKVQRKVVLPIQMWPYGRTGEKGAPFLDIYIFFNHLLATSRPRILAIYIDYMRGPASETHTNLQNTAFIRIGTVRFSIRTLTLTMTLRVEPDSGSTLRVEPVKKA
jgi:hypothetical protein